MRPQPMRVAVVTTFYPNAAEPHRAVFVRNLVRALERYVPITVVSPVPWAPPIGRHPRWRGLRAVPRRAPDCQREVLHPRLAVLPKVARLSGLTYFMGIFGTLRR